MLELCVGLTTGLVSGYLLARNSNKVLKQLYVAQEAELESARNRIQRLEEERKSLGGRLKSLERKLKLLTDPYERSWPAWLTSRVADKAGA